MKNFLRILSIIIISSLMLLGCGSNSTKPNINKDSNSINNSNEENNETEKNNSNNENNSIDENNNTEKNDSKEGNIDQEKEKNKIDTNTDKEVDKKSDVEPYCENEPNKANKDITIVIDPGHSSTISNETEPECPGSQKRKLKDTLGATGVQSKIPEYTITHGVAEELKKLLISEGYNVIMTKDSPDKQLSNIERTTIGNDNNANLIIRIHCDGVDSPKACGASILVPATKGNVTKDISDISYSYGEKILTAYTKYTGLKNRGVVVRDDLTGFNWSKVPIVLIELGFISNPNEDSYLSNPDNYIKIATGISNGINYCFAK